jgi:two-component system OmpR family sensor kinase
MRITVRPNSLGGRVLLALIVGEMIFALVLGITVGIFSTLTVARQREEAIRQVSATIAAGIMPMIADQQKPQVVAQMSSILEAAGIQAVTGICISDSSGAVIACQGDEAEGITEEMSQDVGPLSILLDEQVIVEPIEVDGLRVAEARVRFAPPGMSAFVPPAIATALVLFSAMIVSVPWTAWRMSRDVIEPLDEVGRYASRIADGELDAPLERSGYGEIGDLQDTLGEMALQLKDRDERLRGSYQELSEAYRALEHAKEEIEQLAAVKANFVAVAAHEIRSPLSAIRLYAELLEGGESGALDETALEAVAAIGSASSRLSAIVSDLMDSALLDRGQMPLQFGNVWLEPLLEEAIRDADRLGRPRGMKVIAAGPTCDAIIHGDALRLRQVIDNLLSNALKYSLDNTEVRVQAREDGDWVDIEVADRGRGIPPGSEKQLFALFGRLDFGDSRDTAGLGLGLAISARVVEAHGGHITYRANEEGQGSVFSVRLPKSGPADGGADRVMVSTAESPEQR